VGQFATAVLVGLGLLWIPMMQFISGQLYQYMQSVQAYIAPPIAAVFLLGVFSKRMNARGAIASLLTGFVLGMGRLFAEIFKGDLGGWLYAYANINFLHFAVLLFVVCVAVLVVVSITTPRPPDDQLAGLTYATTSPHDDIHGDIDQEPQRPGWRRTDLYLSLGLVGCVVAVWLFFTG
jgi:SSS family solute:Na+ symporter